MLLYFILFFLILLFVCLELATAHSRNSFFLLFFVLLFYLLSFIRWETGTDWENYFDVFDSIKIPFETLVDPVGGAEVGFMILNNFSKLLMESYTLCLFLQGLILYAFLYISLKTLSPYPLFSLFVFYSMNLGGIFFIRQTIAMAITLFSVSFIAKKKLVKFVLLVLLASTIHRTAILFLFAYFVFWRSYNIKSVLFYISVAAVAGGIIGVIIVSYLSSIGLGEISNRLIMYADSDYESTMKVSNASFLFRGLINRAFVVSIVLMFLWKYRQKDLVFNGIFNLYLFGIVIFVFVAPISRELIRLTGYFDMTQLLIYPYVLYKMPVKYKQPFFLLLTIFFFYRLYVAVNQFPDAYIPYKTIFT